MGDYRQLSVWKRAHGLALRIYHATRRFPDTERYGLIAQLRRAAISVVSNMAEGSGRQSDRELARFLRIARGSVCELECQLLLARDLGFLKSEDVDGSGSRVQGGKQNAQRTYSLVRTEERSLATRDS
jgi:four helix bundle protein